MKLREQLEYAAKACGITGWRSKHGYWNVEFPDGRKESACHDWTAFDAATGYKLPEPTFANALTELGFDPANDQADSDRMACDLEIAIRYYDDYVSANTRKVERIFTASVGHDNTIEGRRRAVREARMAVAVEIGKGMV